MPDMLISPDPSSSATSSIGIARRPGLRIAQRLFLSYVLPLAVLLVAGLALPFVVWSYLGGFVDDYNARAQFADRSLAWRRMALDSDAQARAYVLVPDPTSDQQFVDTRDSFGAQYRALSEFVEAHDDAALRATLQQAYQSYRLWLRQDIRPLRELPNTPKHGEVSAVAIARIRVGFVRVRADVDSFVLAANEYRNRERERAEGFDMMRRIVAVSVPLTAIIGAMLIGRSIALGITRPLERLTQATEALEQGNLPPMLSAGDEQAEIGPASDEITELQRAFGHMARTIRQREAVLRAQNDALGALNRRVEAVLNATNDGVVMLDRAGGFSVVNQRFAHLLGIEAETLQDHTFERAGALLLGRFKNKVQARARFEEILADPDLVVDETFELQEPVNRTLRVYSAPVRGDVSTMSQVDEDKPDELLGRIFVFRDVTRETVVDRMKTEFVSTVSHELRTPLTAIKGYVDLMVGGQTGPLNDVQTEFLTMVQASTRRLTTLINDMLDISRIESGRIEIRHESVAYLPLIEETVRMMQNEAAARQITLAAQLENEANDFFPRVSGDADRITQVLINLISNGIKYTPSGGRVTVRVGREGDVVTTCVEDTGIGISQEDQRRLFQKFFRADNSTTREVGGTGLGLAITKAILEKLNGTVWVDSTPGGGSQFWFTLPTIAAEAQTVPTVNVPAAPTTPRLALYIDDNTDAMQRFSAQMRRRRFTPATALSPAEALRRARDLRPDIILLNPLVTGFDALTLLRELKRGPGAHIPLVLGNISANEEKRLAFYAADRNAPHAVLQRVLPTLRSNALVAAVVKEPMAKEIAALLTGDSRLISGETVSEVQPALEKHVPDLVIADTALTSGSLGSWVSSLPQSQRGDRPLVLLMETELAENVVFLPSDASETAWEQVLHSPQKTPKNDTMDGSFEKGNHHV